MSARRADGGPDCRRCGHERAGHAPYVPGGDRPGYCAACRCWQFIPGRPWSQLLAWMRRRPAPVQPDVLHPRPVRYPVPGWAEDDDDRTLLGIRVAPYVRRPRDGRHEAQR